MSVFTLIRCVVRVNDRSEGLCRLRAVSPLGNGSMMVCSLRRLLFTCMTLPRQPLMCPVRLPTCRLCSVLFLVRRVVTSCRLWTQVRNTVSAFV